MRKSGLTGVVLTFLTVFRVISPAVAEEKLLTYQAIKFNKLLCVIKTPLGKPVEPEVNII